MKALERRQRILETLCERRYEKVENLAFEFSVNESTVRRDIQELSLSYYVTENDVLVHNTCGKISDTVPEGYKPTYENGVYEPNPKHGRAQHGKSSPGLSREYGQYALDHAVNFSGKGKALYAYNGKDILQFNI